MHQLAAELEIQREEQAGDLAEWIVISPDRQELTLQLAYSDRVREAVGIGHARRPGPGPPGRRRRHLGKVSRRPPHRTRLGTQP